MSHAPKARPLPTAAEPSLTYLRARSPHVCFEPGRPPSTSDPHASWAPLSARSASPAVCSPRRMTAHLPPGPLAGADPVYLLCQVEARLEARRGGLSPRA